MRAKDDALALRGCGLGAVLQGHTPCCAVHTLRAFTALRETLALIFVDSASAKTAPAADRRGRNPC